MPVIILHPEGPLQPADLDDYLTAGWRPAGQSIYCSDYLRTDDDALYGCLQLRLPLRGFVFKKRHRKLMRRNEKKFRVEISPAQLPDAAMWEVNRRYMEKNPEKSRLDIEYHVTGDIGWKVFHTHVVRLYDGERLAGFSFFDAGQTCAYTKAGIYDPDYAADSLGTYTILLEIAWCIAQGKSYYHPGYFSPGFPAFDYKMSFGPMEYREVRSGEWLPLPADRADFPSGPLADNLEALERLKAIMPKKLFQTSILEYPSFTACFHYPGNRVGMLDAPYLMTISGALSGMVIYDNTLGEYHYFRALPSGLRDIKVSSVGPSGRRRYEQPVKKGEVLARGTTAEELLAGLNLTAPE
ncbi:GNAT family N-acetyltransferase [Neolewinella agarilytica]|uniref:Arginine-tRNA-protein transferase n=1 Tax=Neolewinella agarilytica TaxID=478744 RepID=A0A1H9HPR9_9BACT|nr:GNAT family N-acetyltransferase [Neolewinella agarilytica]SEQ64330.1 arginine-tRNA-protein transferase [Neolewinella agarilytica]